VVFSPNQIKSIDNDGTWDADDPDIRSNPPMLPAHARARWFHATDQDVIGNQILKDGLILPARMRGGSLTAPRQGFAYMSKSLETAAIYALGGVMMGHSIEDHLRGSRYGWIFELNTSVPVDVEPDEDEVGELLSRGLEWERAEGIGLQTIKADDSGLGWLVNFAKRYVSPSRLERVRDGEYAYFASVGKQLLRRMCDESKLALMAAGSNLALLGSAEVKAARRHDKLKSLEIKPDGSNVLDVAERIL